MKERLSRSELLNILIQDRNHHFNHPHEVTIKFLYFIGGAIIPVIIAFFAKTDEKNSIEDIITKDPYIFLIIAILVVLGYALIIWGLSEHNTLHASQRKRLESAIEYLVSVDPDKFNFNEFWQKFGHTQLNYSRSKLSNTSTGLIVAEPDSRNWIQFHDLKIGLGILFILIGFIGLLITLFA